MKVVTYESPNALRRLSICKSCADRLRDDWPRDRTGRELCRVYTGEHEGTCDVHPAPAVAGATR